MIERYFSQTKVLIRLQSGPVGPYLPGFVSALAESRFSRDSPVVFKAIGFSRRVQLWNRQASIIMDLTTLALRHGWRCLPRV
jgi:hypothetical protein